jgi:hypothetical protein
MSKFCAGICFSMDISHLNKFLSDKVCHSASYTLTENEKIILVFEELSDIFILVEELWL